MELERFLEVARGMAWHGPVLLCFLSRVLARVLGRGDSEK
jgi:hypothetical protein